jgi:magnesium-dependent phosphatase-1
VEGGKAVARGGRGREWLLLVDLDRTLWDHHNVSGMRPPFVRVGEGVIADSRGETLRVYDYMVNLIRWAKEMGAVVAVLSWNKREIAMEAIRALGLEGLFDYFVIEWTPRKDVMVRRLFEELRRRGKTFRPCDVVYIDDREMHLEQVSRELGPIGAIRAQADCSTFESCRRLVEKMLSRCE